MALGFGSKAEDVMALISRKNYSRAIEVLRAQTEANSRDPRLRMQLADVLILAGKGREAVGILTPLADEFAQEGFAAKAIAVLKKIQKVDPSHRGVDARLAALIQEKQRVATVAVAATSLPEIGMEEIGFEFPTGGSIAVPAGRPREPERAPALRGGCARGRPGAPARRAGAARAAAGASAADLVPRNAAGRARDRGHRGSGPPLHGGSRCRDGGRGGGGARAGARSGARRPHVGQPLCGGASSPGGHGLPGPVPERRGPASRGPRQGRKPDRGEPALPRLLRRRDGGRDPGAEPPELRAGRRHPAGGGAGGPSVHAHFGDGPGFSQG
ncbi:MAG: hypothetical protein DMF79_13400 [Acidobacteria bacterium]|nr:MAG: hypothetical protein DMF79_13400 [Acidobacteriota bacterium]